MRPTIGETIRKEINTQQKTWLMRAQVKEVDSASGNLMVQLSGSSTYRRVVVGTNANLSGVSVNGWITVQRINGKLYYGSAVASSSVGASPTPTPTPFSLYLYNVLDHNAVGDGIADDTTAIQRTIDAAYAAGGGTAYFPRGEYRVANLILKNNVNLLGQGIASKLKLLDNACLASHNGSTADNLQYYAPAYATSNTSLTFVAPNRINDSSSKLHMYCRVGDTIVISVRSGTCTNAGSYVVSTIDSLGAYITVTPTSIDYPITNESPTTTKLTLSPTARFFTGFILGTTLFHDGGDRARYKDPDAADYLVQDVCISGLTLDGNKANNTVGDWGHNASAMQGDIVLVQGYRVTVKDCYIINSRMDGMHIGYTLYGPSVDNIINNNIFEGNVRCDIAQMTGRHTIITNNTLLHTNADATGAPIDIEANWTDEINWEHIISHNYIEGVSGIAIVSPNMAKQNRIIVSNNEIHASIYAIGVSTAQIAGGTIIENNVCIGANRAASYAISYGSTIHYTETVDSPVTIRNNYFSGYDCPLYGATIGQDVGLRLEGNIFDTKYGPKVIRPYHVSLLNNEFNMAGSSATGATATATIGGIGAVTGIVVTAGGSGYTGASVITITGSPGINATATPVTKDGTITLITVTNGGTGYTTGTQVAITGTGTGAIAYASTILDGVITEITLTNGGSGYTGSPTVTITGTGSSAAASATVQSGVITSVTVGAAPNGSGYPQDTIATVAGGDGLATLVPIISTNSVTGFTVTAPGSGYDSTAACVIYGGGGSCATGVVAVNEGVITDITLDYGGLYYDDTTVVTITGIGASAVATAINETLGNVVLITMVASGSGYTSATATINGIGTGATANCTITGGVVSAITMTAYGSGYDNTTTVTITGDGINATANAIVRYAIASIAVTNGGDNYDYTTEITITGTGTGAKATAIRGIVTSITVGTPGYEFTSAPTVVISPTSAVGMYVIIGQNGPYYDNDYVYHAASNPYQGALEIKGNTFRSVSSLRMWLHITLGNHSAILDAKELLFEDNTIDIAVCDYTGPVVRYTVQRIPKDWQVTYWSILSSALGVIMQPFTMRRNKFYNVPTVGFGITDYCVSSVFVDNYAISPSDDRCTEFFAVGPRTNALKWWDVERNYFENIDLYMVRPWRIAFHGNHIKDGSLSILYYSVQSGQVGGSAWTGNTFEAIATRAYAVYLGNNFNYPGYWTNGPDILDNNTYIGNFTEIISSSSTAYSGQCLIGDGESNQVLYRGVIPAAGYEVAWYKKGDFIRNSSPDFGDPSGWICTVSGAAAGDVGTWADAAHIGEVGNWVINENTLTATGMVISSTPAYIAAGTVPPTAANAGTGLFLNSTGFYVLNASAQSMKISTAGFEMASGMWLGLGASAGRLEWNDATPDELHLHAADFILDDLGYIGLGAAKGRIVFDDAATDFISLMDAYVGINVAAPAGPLELYQATMSTNIALLLSSGVIAHGVTGEIPTNAYGNIGPASYTAGGLYLAGVTEADSTAMIIDGIIGVADPTDSTPAVLLRGYKASGTAKIALGTAETVLQIRNATTNLFTLLGSGAISIIQQLTSSLAIGTSPFSITSTTKVANLNVDQVDDLHAQVLTATSPVLLSGATSILAAAGITISHATTAGNIHLPTAGATGQIITYGGASGTGAWTTATYPATTTAYQLLISTGTSVIGGLAVGTTGQILVGVSGAVPAWGTDLPTATTIGTAYVYRAGGTDVAVADGGTNLSVYAVGDILYASGTTTIGKLAGVATGQLLVSGGVNTAPAYSATPTITTSLTVPTIYGSSADNEDITIEGTSSATKTTSYVILQPTSGNVGIGTTSPGTLLDVGTNAAFTTSRIRSLGYSNTPAAYANFEMGDGVGVYWRTARDNTNNFQTNMSGTWGILGGNVGIGTTAPVGKLDVADGNFYLTDADVSQPLTVAFPATAYGILSPLSGTAGGLAILGLSDTDATGLIVSSIMGSNNPTDTTPAMVFSSAKFNTTSASQVLGDTETAFQFQNRVTPLVTILGGGNVGIGTTLPGALLDLGLAGTKLGVVRLAGSTSGNVSLQPNAIAGTGIVLTLPATTGTLLIDTVLYGTAADGAISNLTDADTNATTIAQTGTVSLTDNRTVRATGNITISQVTTISTQNGRVRGSFPVTHGSPGVEYGAVLAAVGSKGIPTPIRPGGGTTALCGGKVQFLSGGTIAVNAAINAVGANATSDGGGGGGLVIMIAKTSITGSSAIDVSAAAGHATAAGKGGAGSYSEAPGGHAGIGGSGGAGGGNNAIGGTAGAGYVPGLAGGGNNGLYGGGGAGCLDTVGTTATTNNGTAGAAGAAVLGTTYPAQTIFLLGVARPASTAATAGGAAGGTGGGAGANGGGGGGGGGVGVLGGAGGNGGDCGSGGGGGGGTPTALSTGGAGGTGAAGNAYLYVLSLINNALAIYAGMPGGQGGGGGGGAGRGQSAQGAVGTGGAGAAGIAVPVASMGNGAGGAGATGTNGAAGTLATLGGAGGAGGAGGNGGGAAGFVIMIAPTVSYSGTVTGRHIIIDGTAALDFIRGYGVI